MRVALLVLLATFALGACSASPSLSTPTTAPPPARAADGDGYRLLGYAAPTAFILRIHPTAASMHADVVAAAGDVTAASGIDFVVGTSASATEPDRMAATPEIVVTVGSYCPVPAVGCARIWSIPTPGSETIRGVQISVVPAVMGQAGLLRAVILHELGHAVGLDHMPEPFLGRSQVMSPYVDSSMDSYRDGDLAGLAALGAARSHTPAWSGARLADAGMRFDHDPHDGSGPPLVIA